MRLSLVLNEDRYMLIEDKLSIRTELLNVLNNLNIQTLHETHWTLTTAVTFSKVCARNDCIMLQAVRHRRVWMGDLVFTIH